MSLHTFDSLLAYL